MAKRTLTDQQRKAISARFQAGKAAKKAREAELVEVLQETVVIGETPPPNGLEPDLLRAVEDTTATPQMRARWVRRAFGSRGWPNKEHSGTVKDFLVEHNIPIVNNP